MACNRGPASQLAGRRTAPHPGPHLTTKPCICFRRFPFLLSPCSPTKYLCNCNGLSSCAKSQSVRHVNGMTMHSRLYMSPRSLASRRVMCHPGFGPIDVQSSIRHQPETSLPGHKVARKVGEVAAALQHIAWVSSPHASTPLPSALHAAYPSLRSVIAWRENGVGCCEGVGRVVVGTMPARPTKPRGRPVTVCIRTLHPQLRVWFK